MAGKFRIPNQRYFIPVVCPTKMLRGKRLAKLYLQQDGKRGRKKKKAGKSWNRRRRKKRKK